MNSLFEIIPALLFLLALFFVTLWKREKEVGQKWENSEGKKVAIHDKELSCIHCGGKNFKKREGKITTSFMMLFQLGFWNRSAVCFTCTKCGFVHWFLSPKEKIFREFERDEL